MKTKEEINKVLYRINSDRSKYPGMNYEQGIEEALMWVLEDISDEDFAYSSTNVT